MKFEDIYGTCNDDSHDLGDEIDDESTKEDPNESSWEDLSFSGHLDDEDSDDKIPNSRKENLGKDRYQENFSGDFSDLEDDSDEDLLKKLGFDINWEGLETDSFSEELFEIPQVARYRSHPGLDLVSNLSNIGKRDFDLSLRVLDYLIDVEDTRDGIYILSKVNQRLRKESVREGVAEAKKVMELSDYIDRFTPQGFKQVMSTISKTGEHEAFIKLADYFAEISDIIGNNVDDPNFEEALNHMMRKSFRDAKRIKKRTADEIKEIFLNGLGSTVLREYSKLNVSRRLPFKKLPQDKQDLLNSANRNELQGYLNLINSFPQVRVVPKEKFIELSDKFKGFVRAKGQSSVKDSDLKGTVFEYVRKWIPYSASQNYAMFYLGIVDKVGAENVHRFGPTLLEVLYKRGKDDEDLLQSFLDDVLPKIYAEIPEERKKPPKWIAKLHQKISKEEMTIEEIYQFVDKTVKRGALEQRERDLRKAFPDLCRGIKRCPYKTNEYLMRLDEKILREMNNFRVPGYEILQRRKQRGKSKHKDSLVPMAKAMGKDLEAVNYLFREYSISAKLLVHLYDQGLNTEDIRSTLDKIDPSLLDVLKNLERCDRKRKLNDLPPGSEEAEEYNLHSGDKDIIDEQGNKVKVFEESIPHLTPLNKDYFVDFAEDLGTLEERLKKLEKFSDVDLYLFNLAHETIEDTSLEGSLKYVSSLSEEQKKELLKVTRGHTKNMMSLVDLENFASYVNLFSELSKEDFSVFTEGNNQRNIEINAEDVKDRINKTLKFYYELKKKDRKELIEKYSYLNEAGLVLRLYHDEDNSSVEGNSYDLFKEDWGRVNPAPNHSSSEEIVAGMVCSNLSDEKLLKPFTEIYATLDKDLREKTVSSLYELVAEKQLDFDTLLKHGIKHLSRSPKLYPIVLGFLGQNKDFDKALALSIDQEKTVGIYNNISAVYQSYWINFISDVEDPDAFLDLSIPTFYLAADAFEIVKKKGGNKDKFMAGFNDALSAGTVEPWAEAIIKFCKQDAKGGSSYRIVK